MKILLNRLKPNPRNPRRIDQAQLEKLKTSISSFPEMMDLLPIVIDEKNVILSGNMRVRALRDLGYTEVEVIKAKDLTEEKKKELAIKANNHSGSWDWEALKTDWDLPQLATWGLDMPAADTTTPVSFSAAKREKGTQVRVQCKSVADANALLEDLLKKGFEATTK